ncbi:hypothetical protein, partial [Sporosarcina koreensis]|uniref:hypothetical protein n=1 Tax=Sporosarcina koreensis TaxID=334735 RepID=UPI0027B8919D
NPYAQRKTYADGGVFMTLEFSLDVSKLLSAIDKSPKAVGRGATTAMGDIKDDWVRGAVDIAPLDTSNLRRQIHGEVVNPGMDGYVEIEANAFQDTGGKRFNYAYYIHEQDAGGGQLQTSGTEKKFLDKSLEQRKDEYQKWLEDDVMDELKKAGW